MTFEGKEKEKQSESVESKSVESKSGSIPKAVYVLIALAIGVIAFNQFMILSLSSVAASSAATATLAVGSEGAGSAVNVNALITQLVPRGVPRVYGPELGVSFEDPVNSMSKLAQFDGRIQLSGENLQKYVRVGSKISCEYCCGAPAIIDSRGRAACGCAHSAAMRGLLAYLVDKHSNEFTEEQMLEELGKWKILFFPKNTIEKAVAFASAGETPTVIKITANGFKPPVSKSGSGINAPSMVGGC